MGFYKRFITKDNIIKNISEIDYYLNGDDLIFDTWSGYFQMEVDPEERDLRNSIISKMTLSSGCPSQYHGYEDLKSHSECLISLLINPNWLDIHFVRDKIGFEVPLEEQGSFDILTKKSIETLIKYFDRE